MASEFAERSLGIVWSLQNLQCVSTESPVTFQSDTIILTSYPVVSKLQEIWSGRKTSYILENIGPGGS